MQTIIRKVEPQPILADKRLEGRWIWGPKLPITDMCKGGNSVVSWWNMTGRLEDVNDHCPIERPPSAACAMQYDGEHWVWVVTYSDAAARRWAEQKQREAAKPKSRHSHQRK